MNQWDKWKETIGSLEKDLSKEKGDFSLFGLFRRVDAPDKYDILVSAPWLEKNKKENFEYLVEKISKRLTSEQLIDLSRIVLLEKGNPVLEAILKSVRVKHGMLEVRDSNFSGVQITQACISTSSAIPPTVK